GKTQQKTRFMISAKPVLFELAFDVCKNSCFSTRCMVWFGISNGEAKLCAERLSTFVSAPSNPRHHDACRQGDVSDDGRICRVRARHDSGTRPRRPCEGQERGEASWSASDSPCAGETNP